MIRGYDESGATGLVAGAYRGCMGALLKPLAYMLETSAKVADSITNLVVGVPKIVPRIRPPRYVSPVKPLATYDQSEVCLPCFCAMKGKWLLGRILIEASL